MLQGDLPALLAMSFRAIMDQIHGQLAADGFTDVRPAHGFAFHFLSHRSGATAVELGEHLGITKQAAVQLVDELEKRGYVERTPHPTDRRSRLITLSPRGWQCIEQVVALSRKTEDHWAGLVGEDRLTKLREDLVTFLGDASREQTVTLRPVW
ncbi:MarR family winged helix-turn-helix transcriptional regulator [Amycolatopsis sp.]|jgi:DNA-binding MarR family transcriptional regulator|uniref:MarR family winged helix-turn-helix transcriptional regulator n=1 Tax=Amycolatopsis sp. TaxID=37632 RepID=UPI002DFC9BEC|nr:MarR family transcriptional regulator [Amycolatopsis sp.]